MPKCMNCGAPAHPGRCDNLKRPSPPWTVIGWRGCDSDASSRTEAS